jgi:uncharacterized repeat protein (TIGR02543 family)
MTKVMGKRTLRIVLAMLVLVSVLTLSACGEGYDPYNDPNRPVVISDDGYFYIRLDKSNQTAIALGLTDIGKEQQVLAVPSVVQGFVVVYIGVIIPGLLWGGDTYLPLESEQLQKLYMPHAIWNYGSRNFSTPNLRYAISMDCDHSFIRSYARDFDEEEIRGIEPNIKYYYNYDESPNEDLYWRDYVVEDGLYLAPEIPVRDGYIFGGWYTDNDCTQEWDNVLPTTPEELVELYARWIEQEDTK